MFSEIWALLTHYEEIRYNIKNIIYDENIQKVMNKCNVVPNEIDLRDLNISDKAVLEMFDYFVSLPQCPVELIFTFLKPKPISLWEAVVEKFVSAGYQLKHCKKPETPILGIDTIVENKDFIMG